MRALRVSLLLAPLIGCGDQPAPGVCTALFAEIPLTVVDSSGLPVAGLAISDSVPRTGRSFAVPQFPPVGAGAYVVFDDNFRDQIRVSGDSVIVRGSGTRHFTQGFRFDVPSGCHVRKVAGPDTVIAS